MEKPVKKIVWAVDALVEEAATHVRVAEWLKALAPHCDASVQPVYIRNAGLLRLPASVFASDASELQPGFERRLADWLESLSVPGLLPLKILDQDNDLSLRTRVRLFLDYAQREKADLLAVGTGVKRGTERLLLGSFAETLINHTPTSTLVVNPAAEPVNNVDRVLFPTDFAHGCDAAFEQALGIAQDLGAALTVFHHIDLYPVAVHHFVAPTAFLQYLDTHIGNLEKKVETWTQSAKAAGVDLDCIIERERADTGQAILAIAQRCEADLITLVSQSRGLGVTLFGSTSRDVVRGARSAVWVLKSTAH